MRRSKERKRRLIAALLCLGMIFAQFNSYAALVETEEETVFCEHHQTHTEECGYVEAVLGQPCCHVHNEDCEYIELSGELVCAHTHDEECGYVEAVEESPCIYECEICKAEKTEITDEEFINEESINEESIKENLLRRVKEGSFDPYSSDMSIDEFYALMELFREGALPLEDTDSTDTIIPAARIYAAPGFDEPSADEPDTGDPNTGGNTANTVDIPRTMFLFSGLETTDELKEGDDGNPLAYPVPEEEDQAEKDAYPPGLDPYNQGYLRPPAIWKGVTVERTDMNALQKVIVFAGANAEDHTIAGNVDQNLFLQYQNHYVRRVTAQSTEVTVLGAIKLSGQDTYVYYYLSDEGQAHDVSTTTLPQGQKFIVEYYFAEHKVNYKVLIDSTDGTDGKDITDETPYETFNAETVNLLGTDTNDTWENIIFGTNHPDRTDGGSYSFPVQAPYGYTVEFYVDKEEDKEGPILQLGKSKKGIFTDVNDGWALGMEPDYLNGTKDGAVIEPNDGNGPSTLTMSGVIFRETVEHNRTVIAVVHKNDAPKFLVAPLKHDTGNVASRGTSAKPTVKAKIKGTDKQVEIPYDYEDIYLWATGGKANSNSKFDYYENADSLGGASLTNIQNGNVATCDNWGWQGKAPYNDNVNMTEEADGTYSYQWTFQTNTGDGGYTLDSLSINGVAVTIPFYPKLSLSNADFQASTATTGAKTYITQTDIGNGIHIKVEFLMGFRGDNPQRVYRITATGARSNVTISAMNLMMGGGAKEFITYSLTGVTDGVGATAIEYYTETGEWRSTLQGGVNVEDKSNEKINFNGKSDFYGANIRFKLADGYDSPYYLWEATKDGVIENQASVQRDDDGNIDLSAESLHSVKSLNEAEAGNGMDSQHIYGPDAEGWYYIRITTQGTDYRIALLTIGARAVRYVVRYVPSYSSVSESRQGSSVGFVDDPVDMPEFKHYQDLCHDSFLGTENGILGEQYDDANGAYYDTAVDRVIQLPADVPLDPGAQNRRDYRFVDWVLVDEYYNPIWIYTDSNRDTVQVTTDRNGNRLLVDNQNHLLLLQHDESSNTYTLEKSDVKVHWENNVPKAENEDNVDLTNWVLLTRDGKLVYKNGTLVTMPENTDWVKLLEGFFVLDTNNNPVAINQISEFHYRNNYVTLADINQYAVNNGELGGNTVDIYVLRLMPVWEPVENPFHYTVALNWVDTNGKVNEEYFSESWSDVLTDWNIEDGELTVYVDKDATPLQNWIAQHPTYTFWDAVNVNSAYYDTFNTWEESDTSDDPDAPEDVPQSREEAAKAAMEAEMARAIAEYLPFLMEDDQKSRYQEVLDALCKRDVAGLERDENNNVIGTSPERDENGNLVSAPNNYLDFLRMGGYAYQVREDWGIIVIWMYETKGGLVFHNTVQPAAYLGENEEFYYTIDKATVSKKTSGTGSQDENSDTKDVSEIAESGENPGEGGTEPELVNLDGTYKAYPEKVYDETGAARKIVDADAWLVKFKDGQIDNIVKNDGSPWPEKPVTYFTLKDGDGIMLYVPDGNYSLRELGSKSGGTYNVTTTYSIDGKEEVPDANWGWRLISEDDHVRLRGSSTTPVDNVNSISQAPIFVKFEVGEVNVVQTITFYNRSTALYVENDLIAPAVHHLWKEYWNYSVELSLPEGEVPLGNDKDGYYYNTNIYNYNEQTGKWEFKETKRLVVTKKGSADGDNVWGGNTYTLDLLPHQKAEIVVPPPMVEPKSEKTPPESEIELVAVKPLDGSEATNDALNVAYTVEQKEGPEGGEWTLSGGINERKGNLGLIEPPHEKFVNILNDTGIVITKLVDRSDNKTDNSVFYFTLKLNDTSINGVYGELSFTNGVANFHLKSGESVSAIFPEGLTSLGYTLEEAANSNYTVSWTVDSGAGPGAATSSNIYTDTLKMGMLTGVVCTNKLKEHDLTIGKTVTGEEGDKGKQFNFIIQLTLPTGMSWPTAGYNYIGLGGAESGSITQINQPINIKLKDGQSITIKNLPEGTTYNVVEVEANQDGYATTVQDNNTDNKLKKNGIVQYFNRKPAGGLAISKKVVSPEDMDLEKEFTFTVQFSNAPTYSIWGDKVDLSYIVVGNDGSKSGVMELTKGTGNEYTGTVKMTAGHMLQFRDAFPGASVTVTEDLSSEDPFTSDLSVTTKKADEKGDPVKDDAASQSGQANLDMDTLYTFNFTNTRKTHDLQVEKIVKGNVGDRNKSFTFTVTASDGDNSLTGTYSYETIQQGTISNSKVDEGTITFYDGKATVTLQHGQIITIKGLPEGVTWTVEEDDYAADGYTTEVTVGDEIQPRKVGGKLNDNVKVQYTNTCTASVPTNATMEYLWLIPLLLIASTGAVWMMIKMRRKRYNSE